MLQLTPFTPHHYELLCSWFGTEKELIQWGGWGLTYPLDAAQLDQMLAEGAGPKPARLCWMVEATDGVPVGHVQLALDWQNGIGRIARVGLAPEKRGQRLAVPMLRLVLAQAFALEAIERVELNVFTWNRAAIRTYETLGFVHEGVRRSSAKAGDERWDTAMMGMLRGEWEQTLTAGEFPPT
jgi:RimJ/RimL family protein N-acetyltransferase